MTDDLQSSFTSGEIGPQLYGRIDLARYNVGLRRARNFIIHPQGGASNRPGTEFLYQIPDTTGWPAGTPRLIPFQFNTEQAYMLCFVQHYFCIFKDGEQLLNTSGNILWVWHPYLWSELRHIDWAQSGDMLFMVQAGHPPQVVKRYAEDNWVCEDLEFTDGPWAPLVPEYMNVIITVDGIDGLVRVEASQDIFTPEMVGQMFRVGFSDPLDPSDISWGYGEITQYVSPRVVYMRVEDSLGYDLVYNGEFDLDLNGWKNICNGGTADVSTIAGDNWVTLMGNYAGIQQQITYFSPKVRYRVDFYAESIMDQYPMRIFVGTSAGVREFNALDPDESIIQGFFVPFVQGQYSFEFTAPKAEKDLYLQIDGMWGESGFVGTVANIHITRADLSTTDWRLPAWNPGYGKGTGYPEHITFFEQRMILANTVNFPQTMWMSVSGNFFNFGFFSPGQDDDAITMSLASRKIDEIQWVASTTDLVVGTYNAIWAVKAGSGTDTITPTSITARIQTADGCEAITPILINARMIYVQRGAASVRDLSYNWENDRLQGNDLTVLCKHLFEERNVMAWAYQGIRHQTVWCAITDGSLYGLTYFPEQQVVGWHKHTFYASACHDVAVLNTPTEDEVYMAIIRWNGDGTARYNIERFRPRLGIHPNIGERRIEHVDRLENENVPASIFNDYLPGYDYWFLDYATLFLNDTPQATFTGLERFNNLQPAWEVAALADGAVYRNLTVDNGSVTIPRASYRVLIGFTYTGEIQTLPLALGEEGRTNQGKRQVVNRISMKMYRTRTGFVDCGRYGAEPDEIKFRDIHDGQNPIELRTGQAQILLPAGWLDDPVIRISCEDPVPITVLSINPEVVIGDR